jgi:hypothetical protein
MPVPDGNRARVASCPRRMEVDFFPVPVPRKMGFLMSIAQVLNVYSCER